MSRVSVLTASLPIRYEYLVEAMASVRAQTYQPAIHLIGIDYNRIGGARMLNQLIESVETEWIMPLADDDILLPHHLERLLAVSDGADMVYPWCEVQGRGAWNPNSHFDPVRLQTSNYIPATVLIKTDVVRELGGYPNVVCEDHAMWVKMLEANKVIRCLPEVTWIYRFHRGPGGEPENVSDGYNPWI